MTHTLARRAPRPSLLNLSIRAVMAGMAASAATLHAAEEEQARTLEQVTVIAQAESNKAGSTKTIGMDELNKRGESPTMGSLLRYEPLISAPASASGGGNLWDGSGNNGYNIRGMEGNRVSLDVDGINLPDAAAKPDASTSNSFAMGRDYIDPELFREVRVESGTTTAGRGSQGLAGSVGFVTKSPSDYVSKEKPRYVELKTGYNSVNESYVNAITGAARLGDTEALVVYSHRNGEETQNKGTVAPNGEDWTSDAVLAKLQHTLSNRHKIGLVLDLYRRNADRQLNNKTTATILSTTQDSVTERARVSLEHRFTPAGNALLDSLETRIYTQDSKIHDKTLVDQTTYDRHLDTSYNNKSYGLTMDAAKAAGRHAISYGINADQTESDRPWTEVRTGPGATVVPPKQRMADSTVLKISGYLRDDIGFRLSEHKATLTPGLRLDYQRFNPEKSGYVTNMPAAARELKDSSDFSVLPSLGLAVELFQDFSAYAQFSMGARVPTASERTGTYDTTVGGNTMYAIIGNPDLKKETSRTAELGLKGSPAQGVTLHVSAFQSLYKNFIEYVNDPSDPLAALTTFNMLYRPENMGDATIWGGELSTRFDLGTWFSPVDGTYVALAAGSSRGEIKRTKDARDTNGNVTYAAGTTGDIASVAPARGSLTLGYDAKNNRFGVAATTTYSKGKQAEADVINGAATPTFAVKSYAVHDLSAYWNINKKLSTSAGIYNIGDKKYWDYASVRSLAQPTNAANIANIERQTMPGRSFAVSLNLKF